jgi:hypothetical protein
VNQHDTDLERRLAEIQIELARVGAAVDRPAGNREPVELVESRIWSLTQQFAEILDRWTLSDLRHTRAIGEMEARLKNLETLNARLEHDAEEHLRGLERKIGQNGRRSSRCSRSRSGCCRNMQPACASRSRAADLP